MVWTQIGTHKIPSFLFPYPIHSLTQSGTENVAIDLESFCHHAGRATVTTDDVLLLARKNADLHQVMKDFVDERKAEKEATKGRPKKDARSGGGKR